MNEAQRRASESHMRQEGNITEQHLQKQKSKTAPNTPKHSTNLPPQAPQLPASGGPMDAYTRARTVRIGKWRWPPPKEDGDGVAEGFFEFKMRKMKQPNDGFDISDPRNESLETSGEIQNLEWGDDLNEEFKQGLKRSVSKDSFTIMDDSVDSGQKGKISPSVGNSGSVGKLKISNEMKEKLEAAMGPVSRKSSVRSSDSKAQSEMDISKDGTGAEKAVKKLNENRKMLLEQKLGGGKLKKWDNIDQELHQRASEEVGSRKSSHENKSVAGSHIPAPPPPPIAPSFKKPLHVETDRGSVTPTSSYYSPGTFHHQLN